MKLIIWFIYNTNNYHQYLVSYCWYKP